jgi:hypothetical protein
LSGASGDDGFDAYGFVGYAVGTALVEGLVPVAFEGVVVVAELGGAGVPAGQLRADDYVVQRTATVRSQRAVSTLENGEQASTSWWHFMRLEQVPDPAR